MKNTFIFNEGYSNFIKYGDHLHIDVQAGLKEMQINNYEVMEDQILLPPLARATEKT